MLWKDDWGTIPAMTNPFKDLVKTFNRLLDGEFSPDSGINRLGHFFSRAVGKIKDAQQPYTELERDIVARHRNFSNNKNYHAILVSIRPDMEGRYSYTDPRTGMEEKAELNICALQTCYTLENGVRLERSAGYKVVMALDIRKPPEEQIRGWQAGTLVFPDKYLGAPLITVADPKNVLARSADMTGIVPSVDISRQVTTKPAFLPEDIVARNEDGERYRAPCFIRSIIDGPNRNGP